MIYVLSDIHGNERRFRSIWKQINLKQEDTLYVLGDVIDRHPGGLRILRKLMAMPNVNMILGNHEYMMLRALGQPYDDNVDDGRALEHWYRNGGKVTHDHLKHLRKTLRQEIVDYLLALPLSFDIEVNGKTYKLVHGAPIEEYDHDPKYKNPITLQFGSGWSWRNSSAVTIPLFLVIRQPSIIRKTPPWSFGTMKTASASIAEAAIRKIALLDA